jgi:hypothetical protein
VSDEQADHPGERSPCTNDTGNDQCDDAQPRGVGPARAEAEDDCRYRDGQDDHGNYDAEPKAPRLRTAVRDGTRETIYSGSRTTMTPKPGATATQPVRVRGANDRDALINILFISPWFA